ncbi:MAG: adenosylcobinamide amidohydrolase, partial [Candidatus Dadabacteria bacterium]|nr:adenosylcobinamide amidohydrolase [Candidatus Dadabacteria bacterium]
RADAIITAGVSGNAARAGDPASWHEASEGWKQVSPHAGTINIMLLLNCSVTPSALARAVITMTEAKSSILAELAVPSLYSATIATGTGTDQFCVAAPLASKTRPREYTGPHSKLGECIGTSVREALRESLRWQNGLEPSYTRSLFHALGRFGLTEKRAMAALSELLPESSYGLLSKNLRAVFYEPGVAAAGYAFAAVLDRIAAGTLPDGFANDALRQQAACLACSLSARQQQWTQFYEQIPAQPDDPVELVLQALALGWAAKWT